MNQNVQVFILSTEDEKEKKIREKLSKQTVKPVKVETIFADSYFGGKAWKEMKSKMQEKYALILSSEVSSFDDKVIETMLSDIQKENTAFVSAKVLFASKNTATVLVEEILNHRSALYSLENIYEHGVEAFLNPFTCVLVDTESVMQFELPLYLFTDPGVLLSASLLYAGKTLSMSEAEVTVSTKLTNKDLKVAAFDFGISEKVHTEILGVDIGIIKPRKRRDLSGKRKRPKPLYNKDMTKIYKAAKKRAGSKVNLFQKVSLQFLVSAMNTNDFFGQYYFRLPAGITRNKAGRKEFFM